MATVVRGKETGQYYIKLPGDRLLPIPEEQVPYAQESSVESFIRSVGNSVAQVPTGIGTMLGSEGSEQAFRDLQTAQQGRTAANPISSTLGSVAPDVAVGAVTGGSGTLAKRVGQTAIVEGALGASRNPDNPVEGALIQGGAAAGIVGAGPLVSRFTRTARNAISSVPQSASTRVPQELAEAGYRAPFYAGRGQAARQLGASVESAAPINLLTGAGRRIEGNQEAIGRLAQESVIPKQVLAELTEKGAVNSGKLDTAFFQSADEMFSELYEGFGKLVGDISNDAKLAADIQSIRQNNISSVTKSDKLEKILERIEDKMAKGTLTGKEAAQARSDLSAAAFQQFRSPQGDRQLALSLSKAEEVVRQAIGRALKGTQTKTPQQIQEAWSATNTRYRALKNLDKGKAVDFATGDVNERTLFNNIVKSYGKNSQALNDDPLFQALKYHLDEGVTGIPDSGTATRQLLPQVGGALIGGSLVFGE